MNIEEIEKLDLNELTLSEKVKLYSLLSTLQARLLGVPPNPDLVLAAVERMIEKDPKFMLAIAELMVNRIG